MQIKTFYKACPTEGDYRLCHDRPRRVGVLIRIYKRLAPPKAITDYVTTATPPPLSPCGLASLAPKSPNLSHQITPIYPHHLVDFSPKCKLFIKKCCFLTFPMQNSPVSAVLVGGVFLSQPENAPLPRPEKSPQTVQNPRPRPVDFSAKNQLILPQQSAKIISIFFGGPPPQRSEYDEQYPGALRQPGL